MRLFVFPFAGGSASFFNKLEQSAVPEIGFVKLEYPGHGQRIKERLCTSFSALSEDLYPAICDRCQNGEDYALLGYSMGSIAVLDILRTIIVRGRLPLPKHVFLAAHEPSIKEELARYTDDALDEWIMDRTVKFGGIPVKLLNSRTFWRVYLPIYRADYSMIGKYDFRGIKFETTIPATFFYSETDTPLTAMLEWKRIFVGETEFYRFDGNHFFINEHYQEMADIIKEKCLR